MTFEAYWKRLVDATPGLRHHENSMRIGVQSFREAIKRAYEAGRRDAHEEVLQEADRKMPGFMEKLFRRK